MFEQSFAHLLRQFLGDFVEGGSILDEKVQLGVWSGNIVLEQLVLKKSILNAANAPISLAYGSIGRLEFQIPWSSLNVDPIIVNIDRVLILLEPKYEWNPDGCDIREQAVKQAKLAAAELLFSSQRKSSDDPFQSYKDYAKKWLFESVINRIIENIQINIRDVHIRYEDHISCPGDFAIGVTLESFHANSRNNSIYNSDVCDLDISGIVKTEKERAFADHFNNSSCIHKIIELRHFSSYWSPLQEHGLSIANMRYVGRPMKDIETLMLRAIPRQVHVQTDRPQHHYTLLPMDMLALVDINIDHVTNKARTTTKIIVPCISVCLEDRQFREMISLSTNMSNFMQLEKASAFRPRGTVVEDPRAWWRYAINAVVKKVRSIRKFNLSWDRLKQRRNDRLVYVELWKWKQMQLDNKSSNLATSNLTILEKRTFNYRFSKVYTTLLNATLHRESVKIESSRSGKHETLNVSLDTHMKCTAKEFVELLDVMEFHLSFEDIYFFRCVANLAIENSMNQQSWLGGIITWKKTKDEENKKSLYKLFANEKDENIFDPNTEEINNSIMISIIQSSFTFGLSTPSHININNQSMSWNSISTCLPFLEVESFGLSIGVSLFGDGTHVVMKMSLHDMEAYEVVSPTDSGLITNGYHYNKLMSRRSGGAQKQKLTSPRKGSKDANSSNKALDRHSKLSHRIPVQGLRSLDSPIVTNIKQVVNSRQSLFCAEIELTPYIKMQEVTVKVELEELEVLVSPAATWVNCMATFASWPEDVEYWSEMEMKALNQLADFKSRLEAKIDFMMNNHKNVVLEANINAPVLIICPMKEDVDDADDDIDMVVINLGKIQMRTEKLAKAQYEQTMLEREFPGGLKDSTMDLTPDQHSKLTSESLGESNISLNARNIEKLNLNTALANQVRNFEDATTPLWDSRKENKLGGGRESETDKIKQLRRILGDPTNEVNDNNSMYSSRHAPSTVFTLADKYMESTLYDSISIAVSDVEVFMIRTEAWKNNRFDPPNKSVIVDKFDVNVVVQISVLPWDTELPPAKLFVKLPNICIQLSEAKLLQLVKFNQNLINNSQKIIEFKRNTYDKFEAVLEKRSHLEVINEESEDSKKEETPFANEENQDDSYEVHDESHYVDDMMGDQDYPDEVYESSSEDDFFDAAGESQFSTSDRRRSDRSSLNRSSSMGNESFYRVRKSTVKSSPINRSSSANDNNSVASFRTTRSNKSSSSRRRRSTMLKLSKSDTLSERGSEYYDNASELSDDSFMSAEGDQYSSEQDVLQDLENTQHAIKQQEILKAKLVSNIRLIEGNPTKRDLLNTLLEDLAVCDSELQHLRIKYVEISMALEEFQPTNEGTQSQIHRVGVLDTILMQSNIADDYHKKKTFMRSSFFKPRPEQIRSVGNRKGIGGNKQLVYLMLAVASFKVELLCSNTEKVEVSETQDIGKVLLELKEIQVNAKHSAIESTVLMRLGDLKVEFIRTYGMSGGVHESTSFYLVSSDSASTGLSMSHLRPLPNRLLSLKYHVKFDFGDYDGITRMKPMIAARHKIDVRMGYLGINVEQNGIVMIMGTVNRVVSAIAGLSNGNGKESIAPSTAPEVNQNKVQPANPNTLSTFVNATIIGRGMAVALVEQGKPIVSFQAWSLGLDADITPEKSEVDFHLVDARAYHHCYVPGSITNRHNEVSKRFMLFGHKEGYIEPFLKIDAVVHHFDEFNNVGVSGTISPLTFVVAPCVVTDVADYFLNGPLMKFINGMNENGEVKVAQVKSNPSPLSLSSALIDVVLSPVLKRMSGNFEFKIGECEIQFPTVYEVADQTKMQMIVREIGVKCKLGDFCMFEGMEASFEVRGSAIKINNYYILEPFDILTYFAAKPKEQIVVYEDSMETLPPRIVIGNTMYPPKIIDTIRPNEVQMSTSVSPIIFHVNEYLMHCISKWIRCYSELSNSLPMPAPKSNETNDSNSTPAAETSSADYDGDNSPPLLVGIDANIHTIIHEISFCIDADVKILDYTMKQHGMQQKLSLNANKPTIRTDERLHPLFKFSMNHMEVLLSCKTTSDESVIQSPLSIATVMKSVHFVYNRPGHSGIKRLMTTCSSDILSPENTFLDDPAAITDEHFNNNLMVFVGHVFSDRVVSTKFTISNFQLGFSPGAVTSLATMGILLQNAFESTEFAGFRFLETERRLKTMPKSQFHKEVLSPSALNIHPISVPLAKANDRLLIQIAKANVQELFVTAKSFMLPAPLRSISFTLQCHNCGLWLPSNEFDKSALAIHMTGDYEFHISFQPHDLDTIISNDNLILIDTMGRLRNGQVFLSRVTTSSLFTLPNTISESSSYPSFLNDLKADNNIKTIVAPCSIEILHSMVMSPIKSKPDFNLLSQSINIVIDSIDVSLYLDYRFFETLYHNTIEPLQLLSQAQSLVSKPKLQTKLSNNSLGSGTGASTGGVPIESILEPEIEEDMTPTSSDKSINHDIANITSIHPANLFELLAHLPTICETKLTVEQYGISVTLWNDIYYHPFPLFRFALRKSTTKVDLLPPLDVFLYEMDTGLQYPHSTAHRRSISKSSRDRHLTPSSSPDRNRPTTPKSTMKEFSSPLSSKKTLRKSMKKRLTGTFNIDNYAVVVSTSLDIYVEYHNHDIMTWEPLLEPTNILINVKVPKYKLSKNTLAVVALRETDRHELQFVDIDRQNILDRNLNVAEIVSITEHIQSYEVFHRLIESFGVENVGFDPLQLRVDIISPMNINVTIPLLDSISQIMDSIKKLSLFTTLSMSKDNNTNMKFSDLSVIMIRNDLGVPISYKSDDMESGVKVSMNSIEAMKLNYHRLFDCTKKSKDAKRVTITLPLRTKCNRAHADENGENDDHYADQVNLVGVPLDGTGSYLYSLESTDGTSLVNVDIGTQNGLRTLALSSTLRLVNHSPVELHVVVKSMILTKFEPQLDWEITIPVNSTVHVPLNYCQTPIVEMLVSPIVPQNPNNKLIAALIEISGCSAITNDHVLSNHTTDEEGIDDMMIMEELVENATIALNAHLHRTNDTFDSTNWTSDDSVKRDNALLACNHLTWRKKAKKGGYKSFDRNQCDSHSHWLAFPTQRSPVLPQTTSMFSPTKVLYENSRIRYGNTEVMKSDIRMNLNTRVASLSDYDSKSQSEKTESGNISIYTGSTKHVKEITFTAPIKIVNVLACPAQIVLLRDSDFDVPLQTIQAQSLKDQITLPKYCSKTHLNPKDEWNCMDFHAIEDIGFVIRLESPSSSTFHSWSSMVIIPGSKEKAKSLKTYSVDVRYDNGSLLTVLIDVEDVHGDRKIHVYTPFWIVSSSIFDLQYQHDTLTLESKKTLNGIDELCADQIFSDRRKTKTKALASHHQHSFDRFQAGMSRIRGVNGVILGPEHPIRGLPDLMSAHISRDNISTWIPGLGGLINRNQLLSSSGPFGNDKLLESMQSSADVDFSLMQCSYTDLENSQSRLRMRSCGSDWSKSFSLDGNSDFSMEIQSFRKTDITTEQNTHRAQKKIPPLRSGKQIFNFSLQSFPAEDVFHRTKIVLITDQYNIINMVDHTIEVCQVGHEDEASITSVPSHESAPLWWRSGKQLLQIRLAKNGWSWSGKIPVNIANEVYVRLRNDMDNTVYFMMVKVAKNGSRVTITVSGGEKVIAPYRFENHTLQTFRIKQMEQSLYTMLLPYHACLYAWDEPFSHYICALERQEDSTNGVWKTLGQYKLDQLQSFDLKGNLLIRIISEGPTRVMQLFDSRSPPPIEIGQSLPDTAELNNDDNDQLDGDQKPFDHRSRSWYNDEFVKMYLKINVTSVGLSVIDDSPNELIYASIGDISVKYSQGERFDMSHVCIGQFQVDNQTDTDPIFPSIIHNATIIDEANEEGQSSNVHESTSNTQLDALRDAMSGEHTSKAMASNRKKMMDMKVKNAFAVIDIIRDFTHAGVSYFPMLKVKMSPFHVNIEGNLMVHLLKFGNKCASLFAMDRFERNPSNAIISSSAGDKFSNVTKKIEEDFENEVHPNNSKQNESSNYVINDYIKNILKRKKQNLSLRESDLSTVVFCKHLSISDFNIFFSLNPCFEFRSIAKLSESRLIQLFGRIGLALISTIIKIDRCPIKFSGTTLKHRFLHSNEGFKSILARHYSSQLFRQVYTLVGSLEALGHPFGFTHTLSKGLYDFVCLPVQGLLTNSPHQFISGVFFGSLSLSSRLLVSTCNTLIHMASSLKTGLLTLGLVEMLSQRYQDKRVSISQKTPWDEDKISQIEKYSNVRPKNIVEGLRFAVRGLIYDPIYGYYNKGLQGFVNGIIRGSLGMLIRPLFGLLQGTSFSLQRLSQLLLPQQYLITDDLETHPRQRLPRELAGLHNPLQIYALGISEGRKLFMTMKHQFLSSPLDSREAISIFDSTPVHRFKQGVSLMDANATDHHLRGPHDSSWLDGEVYKWHSYLFDGRIVMITSHRILVIRYEPMIDELGSNIIRNISSNSRRSFSSQSMDDNEVNDEFEGSFHYHNSNFYNRLQDIDKRSSSSTINNGSSSNVLDAIHEINENHASNGHFNNITTTASKSHIRDHHADISKNKSDQRYICDWYCSIRDISEVSTCSAVESGNVDSFVSRPFVSVYVKSPIDSSNMEEFFYFTNEFTANEFIRNISEIKQ